MFKSVRKRLSLLYTVTTGAILTAVIVIALIFSLRDSEKQQRNGFLDQWLNISSRLQFDSVLSHSFLAQMETKNKSIIYIEENGMPLMFNGAYQPPTDRRALIAKAREAAAGEGVDMTHAPVSSSMNQSSVMELTGDQNDQYYAMVLTLPTKKGVKSLLLISYLTPGLQMVKPQLLYLLLLDVAGIAGLALVSWFFVGWSLKPVEESRRKQSEFIAAASHELRSPLAVIRSSISAIASAPKEQAAMLANIDKECSRMSLLVSDMLLLASSDAQAWSMHRERVDVDTLLIETYEAYQPLCREKGLKLSLDLPGDPLPALFGDQKRLEQVLIILLDNAVSYTSPGKSITIRACVSPHKRQVTIEVCDQGCGIPDEQKEHIFDRFYRGDASRNDKRHFGLGLSIAVELAAMHGGTLTVADNEEPEGGSRFILSLPFGERGPVQI